jgi:glutathione peroxidase
MIRAFQWLFGLTALTLGFCTLLGLGSVFGIGAWASASEYGFYALSASEVSGRKVAFSEFQDKVVVIFNFSSSCGTTPQLEDMQKLYSTYKDKGLVVLGFPSEDYGAMDTTTDDDIQIFCRSRYDVEFPIFSLTRVTGPEKSHIFRLLTEQGPELLRAEVGFNFEKFVIGKKGQMVARFGPFTSPMSARLRRVIESELER